MRGSRNDSRFVRRDGTFNVAKSDAKPVLLSDLYHSLARLHWAGLLALIGTGYLATNLLFGLAYFLCGPGEFDGMRAETPKSFFLECFFFSVQTLATIGYGRISPVGLLANSLVTIEALAGLLGLALVTGLIFNRFSRPTAKIVFSDVAVIAPQDGVPCLIFRIANQRLNQIAEARVNVVAVKDVETREGETYRDLYALSLERDESPIFTMSWVIVHPIVLGSPLHGLDRQGMIDCDLEVVVTLSGTDETLLQPILARFSYKAQDIRWDHRFKDMLSRGEDDTMMIALERIHETEPLPGPLSEPRA